MTKRLMETQSIILSAAIVPLGLQTFSYYVTESGDFGLIGITIVTQKTKKIKFSEFCAFSVRILAATQSFKEAYFY